MRALRRGLALLLALALAISLAGCGAGAKEPQADPGQTSQAGQGSGENSDVPDGGAAEGSGEEISMDDLNVRNTGFGGFADEFAAYVEAAGYAQENYMISPTSFRAALALAIAGADGETKEQLLKAAGFSDEEEMYAWYRGVSASIERFAEDLELQKERFERDRQWLGPDAKGPDGAFRIANSFWKNAAYEGSLVPGYKAKIEAELGAGAFEASPEEITGQVNRWVDEATNGMIPAIASDLSKSCAVLVNALYLRSSWIDEFSKFGTEPGDFICADGSKVQKDFMNARRDTLYYEDEGCKLVILPMRGGVDAVFVLGSAEDLAAKMNAAEYTQVRIMLPKFEIESSFSAGELPALLKLRGAELPFDPNGRADFSAMIEGGELWYISDIIQKSKIRLDEEGIEAAAVTAMMMAAGAAMPPEDPKEFIADRPFSFFLITDSEAPELLFSGQLVK